MLSTIFPVLLLIFGFGFVIFWHELGHFLAAKWAGVKVEQFAVGFGQALVSFRKGVGVRVGSTEPDYKRQLEELRQSDPAARDVPGISETEYRLNWIPLGGYVKMLGQDDMNPNSQSEDPRAYNRKPVFPRMVIISAGVIMNIILAVILFFLLFFVVGFQRPPAVVGEVRSGSPAQLAGLRAGDEIIGFNDNKIYDFTKVVLNTALAPGGSVPVVVIRDGQEVVLQIDPEASPETRGMPGIGVGPAPLLVGPPADVEIDFDRLSASAGAVRLGEQIVEVAGTPVTPQDIGVLSAALQASAGKAVPIVVETAAGDREERAVAPTFSPPFSGDPINFLGLEPRVSVASISEGSDASGKLQPDDIILSIRSANGDLITELDQARFVEVARQAGATGEPLTFTVQRDGQTLVVPDVSATFELPGTGTFGLGNARGLGVGVNLDFEHAVVANVIGGSPAAEAGMPAGFTVTEVNGTEVASWFDVVEALRGLDVPAGDRKVAVQVSGVTSIGEEASFDLSAGREHVLAVATLRYTHSLALEQWETVRETSNPLTAVWWGAEETKDFVLQAYLTLRRMLFDRTVSPTNLMGPVGIVQSGTMFAFRGTDWLIWFLAMISANLAVVNFLPIPIVDGGHFVFLCYEKIRGKPPSPAVQNAAQLVGLVLLLGIFVFVTVNDIIRLM